MSYLFELKTEHGIDINPGDYFETLIFDKGSPIEESQGKDEFQLHALLLPGKRVAGFGRQKSYSLQDLPVGLSALEAEPSSTKVQKTSLSDLTFKISTNIILDQGLLAHYLALNMIGDNGETIEIPLNRPDVKIDWQSRGTYLVKVGNLLC